MSSRIHAESIAPSHRQESPAARHAPFAIFAAVVVTLLATMYWNAARHMYGGWTATDSYYTHGFLIPLISLFFAWRSRAKFAAAKQEPSPWGLVVLAGAAFMHLAATFLGFMVFSQLSLVPMLFGLSLAVFGVQRTKVIWFPLAFLVFMIPLPGSVTQSFALHLKLMATDAAVLMANWMTLPMVQEGSFIYFRDEHLLVGEVCGGLRSLIALLAFGAVAAYISQTRRWAQGFLLFMSAPIAIVSNVFRIFLLCVVGYFYGAETAAGTFHDVSGVLIFVVAFILFFTLETQLRKWAPPKDTGNTGGSGGQDERKDTA